MGLLDEAIRDHLDLKRRQGADPDEIARKEREALEPVIPDEPATWGADPESLGHDNVDGPGQLAPGEALPGEAAVSIDHGIHASTVGQETVEIDMLEVLWEDVPAPTETDPTGQPELESLPPGQPEPALHDVLELGVAGQAVQEIPGQERLSFE